MGMGVVATSSTTIMLDSLGNRGFLFGIGQESWQLAARPTKTHVLLSVSDLGICTDFRMKRFNSNLSLIAIHE